MKSTDDARAMVSTCGMGRTPARRVAVRQSGMTIIELLIALAIVSLMSGVLVMAVYQILITNTQANDQQYAVSQLRQAEHWLTRDTLTAQAVTPDTVNATGFPLLISWTTNTGVPHSVTYTLQDMPTGSLKRLQRLETVAGTPSALWVAEDIDAGDGFEPPLSWCSYSKPVLTVMLTITSGAHTETRTFEAKARSDLVA